MFATKSLLVIGLICISSAICEKIVCEFENSDCLTETANLTFEQFIAGMTGVESSEPLHQKLIDANLPTLKYKFIDAKLSGMKKCKVELVKISSKDLKYDYHVGCPHLTLVGGYELNGDIGPQRVEGKGTCQIDFYDYHFQFHGDYVGKEGKAGKSHINLKTHTLNILAKGKVVYDFKNLFDGNKEKSDAAHTYVNDNWPAVDEGSRGPAMNAFMDQYINNVNAYLDIVPVQDLFSYEK